MALNKGVWDPKLRGTNIKGTNLKSLIDYTLHSAHLPDDLHLSLIAAQASGSPTGKS